MNPKPVLRIRSKSFGSCFRIRPAVSFESGSGFESGSESGFKSGIESRIWIRIRIPDSGSGSETGLNFLFLYKNFYAASSSNIKSLPSLSSVTWLRTNCARNFQSTRISHIYAFCMCSVPPMPMNLWLHHKKIRLIEGNAKCRHLKKLACKGTLQQVFLCLKARTPIPPPPYTMYLCIQYIYSHRKGGSGGES